MKLLLVDSAMALTNIIKYFTRAGLTCKSANKSKLPKAIVRKCLRQRNVYE